MRYLMAIVGERLPLKYGRMIVRMSTAEAKTVPRRSPEDDALGDAGRRP